jgi:hypothetical protein
MASGVIPTNPGTADEKPVLVAVLFGDVAIAGVKADTDGAGTDGDLGAFFAILSATALADLFLAVDNVGLAID